MSTVAFAFRQQLVLVLDEMLDMTRIVGRADRRHRARFGDALRGREHRRAAETVTEKDLRR
jgi:hypothetical protein